MGKAVAWFALRHSLRLRELVVEPDETLAVGVISLDFCIDGIESIVVAALTILCLVIDGRAFHLYLAGGEVALEVLHIGGCIPQAPFGKGEHLEGLRLLRLIFERHLLYLSPSVKRNKEEHTCLHTVLASRNAGIVHTVTALVAVEWSFAGFPSGVPHGVAILDIEIATAIVHRHAVVSVAGDATELGILVEGITTCCVGDEGEEILVAQIIDPRPWGLRIGNHVLAIVVIEMTILFFCHCLCSIFIGFYLFIA